MSKKLLCVCFVQKENCIINALPVKKSFYIYMLLLMLNNNIDTSRTVLTPFSLHNMMYTIWGPHPKKIPF